MSTTTTPPRDSSVCNTPQKKRIPGALPRTDSSPASSSSASSSECSRFSTPPAELSVTSPTRSFLETLVNILQWAQTTIWLYILSFEPTIRQYIDQYYPQKGSKDTEAEKMTVRKDSLPEINGRSRTGSSVREQVMTGGSKRGSLDENGKTRTPESGCSSEGEQRRQKSISAKGTGFDEPFCRFRNTTLPHPAADLSHNACIYAPEVAQSKVHHHRMHIPGRRSSNKNILSGKILPGDAGFSTVGRLGGIALNESAMGSSLEGLYDDLVYEDGSKQHALTKSRTGLSGSTRVDSIKEVETPNLKVEIPQVKITQPPVEPVSVGKPQFSMSDWEGETSKALENIMSPLSRHPVNIDKCESPRSTNAEKFQAKAPTTPMKPTAATTVRPSSISSASPIIKPGGFKRVSATSPNHGKKDSGIGMGMFESSNFGINDDDGDDTDSITPSKKKGKGLLRKLKMQKG